MGTDQLFRFFIGASHDLITVFDDRGQIALINEAATAILGAPPGTAMFRVHRVDGEFLPFVMAAGLVRDGERQFITTFRPPSATRDACERAMMLWIGLHRVPMS